MVIVEYAPFLLGHYFKVEEDGLERDQSPPSIRLKLSCQHHLIMSKYKKYIY